MRALATFDVLVRLHASRAVALATFDVLVQLHAHSSYSCVASRVVEFHCDFIIIYFW